MTTVTLTTDFGTRDGYVGAMKGVITSRAPDARIVDIAHDIPPYNVIAASYCLGQAAPYFPPGTIHVGVVDPGVGTSRQAVVLDDGSHLYVGPDNGLFSWVVPTPRAAYAIEAAAFMRSDVSETFHGRDIFAAAAGALAAGMRPQDAGPMLEPKSLTQYIFPALACGADGKTWTTVVHVDRFGNLITACRAADLPDDFQLELGPGLSIARISRTFGDVERGQLVAYIGSAKTIEIAVREDSAARILGMRTGDEIIISRRAARAHQEDT